MMEDTLNSVNRNQTGVHQIQF